MTTEEKRRRPVGQRRTAQAGGREICGREGWIRTGDRKLLYRLSYLAVFHAASDSPGVKSLISIKYSSGG